MNQSGTTGLLDPGLAEILQQIAIFVEAAGFSLVVLEIYFPKRADELEDFLDKLATNSPSIREAAHIRFGVLFTSFILAGLQAFVFFVAAYAFRASEVPVEFFVPILIMTLINILLFYGLIRYAVREVKGSGSKLLKVVTFPWWGPMLLYNWVFVWTLVLALRLGNMLAKDRAVGSLGLMLSAVGLTFEAYQVSVLWWGPR